MYAVKIGRGEKLYPQFGHLYLTSNCIILVLLLISVPSLKSSTRGVYWNILDFNASVRI
jgi:hypothetical protein